MPTSRVNYFLSIIIVYSVCFSCHSQNPPIVSGIITTTPEWKPYVYLVMPRHFREIAADYQGQVLDSALIDPHGHFSFDDSALPDARALLQLVVQKQESRFANHLDDDVPQKANYMPFIYVPGHPIEIRANINTFQNSCQFISPSQENQSIQSLRDIRNTAHEIYVTIANEMNEDDQLIEKEKAYYDYIHQLMDFADTTTVPEPAFVAIRWVSPTNDLERIPEFITRQCNRWKNTEDVSSLASELCALADEAQLPIMTGDTIPDFAMPMANGDTVRLHSILGNKLTILDLWASWCAPCRKENRNVLMPLFEKYQQHGLQIIGYSLDAEDKAWKAAIQKDQAIWSHASHLAGDNGPFMETLRITTIPANYILDKHGLVLAKNLHGAELENWLKEYLEK